MSFELLGDEIVNVLNEFNITSPTDIQKSSIPEILKRNNVLLMAPTGSGKTEAAILPLLKLVKDNNGPGIKILYIAPLRALNRDLLQRLEKIGAAMDITIKARHGDTVQSERRRQSLKPPDILITTPETLQALFTGKKLREHLKSVLAVVVDEIHEIAEDKRGVQLSLALERLERLKNGRIQRIGLSATVGSKEEVGKFLVGEGREVKIIQSQIKKEFDIEVETPKIFEEDIMTAENLKISPYVASSIRRIKELIDSHKSVLLFVNTRQMAETLSSRFNLMEMNFIDVHHSSLSKETRIDVETRFKNGEIKGIVCTSSMELGIDVGAVDLVIQYGSPRQVSKLLQRVGRAGHKTYLVSKGVILTSDEEICESAVIAKSALNYRIERSLIPEKSLDVLSHQIIGLSMESNEVSIEEAYTLFKKSYPYRNMSYEEFWKVLYFLESIKLIWINNGITYKRSKQGFFYYYENLSMIPDTKQYRVVEVGTGSSLGVLDENFIVSNIEVGGNFIVRGRTWKVLNIEEEKIEVTETRSVGAIPSWEGELIPVPLFVSREVFELFHDRSKVEELPLTKDTKEILYELFDEQSKYFSYSKDSLVIEDIGEFVIIHIFNGSKANDTLGRVITSLLAQRFGESIGMRTDPYHIMIKFPQGVKDGGLVVKNTLLELNEDHVIPILDIVLKNTPLFEWKMIQIAKRFGVVRANSEKYLMRNILKLYRNSPLYEETLNELYHDKLEIDPVKEFIRNLKEGKIKITINKNNEPSTFTRYLLEGSLFELLYPKRPDKEIIKYLKKRLMEKRVTVACLHCKNWKTTLSVNNFDENPKCPQCGARYLGILRRREDLDIVRKGEKGKIEEEQKKTLKEIKDSADLVLPYGKKAIIVLAGIGIGPRTAKRILAKDRKDEEDLFKDILSAERVYARTKMFWQSNKQ
ncbi:MAG: putative ski2-type helicase [Candidatus Methanofastidiosum methylothiophilum]|uniref:Putative ski2-type helicase n=1 Tax=Candidatus Methanofastidiosum methylothiophilum TaxID=1705564 RepID=A0A150IND9_9EURY|nr:MAG: putative ski2-type helicase [Candidatus Methanofastidiosum methylthiophilus]KYC48430.1 MAG: putative ski2-type helicase [Candidatus Methanofastidiosum methylthiophilus]